MQERWLRGPNDLGNVLALIGLISFGIGRYTNLPVLTNLGIAGFGAGVVAWGAGAVLSGEMIPFRRRNRARIPTRGFLARVWGIVLALAGFAIMGFGILSVLNPREPIPATLRQYFSSSQGIAILFLVGSAIGMLQALTMIFFGEARSENPGMRFLLSLPGRLAGVFLFLFFGAVAAVSLAQLFMPGTWEMVQQSLWQALGVF